MTSRSGGDAPSPERLQTPVARILRPLVRLLIRSGLTFPALCDLLREIYVEVAEHDYALPGKPQTDSRITLLTGVHRKEVRRLRDAGAVVAAMPPALSQASRIIAQWIGGEPFSDARGNPHPLPRTGPPEEASFEALVGAVTKDVRARAIMDEWLDRKVVQVQPDGKVVLADGAFAAKGDEGMLYYFGRNMADHAAAAVSNIMGGGPVFLERAVHYDNLSEGLANRLADRSKGIAMDALREANLDAHAACATDGGGPWRWVLGTYVYVERAKEAASVVSNDDDDPAEGNR